VTPPSSDASDVAKDIFIDLDRCTYCGRPGSNPRGVDLFTCGRELCECLAYAELKRRAARGCGDLVTVAGTGGRRYSSPSARA
jgi:hypothetical protein